MYQTKNDLPEPTRKRVIELLSVRLADCIDLQLQAVGESANRWLCDAETADALPAPDVVTFHEVTQPSRAQ